MARGVSFEFMLQVAPDGKPILTFEGEDAFELWLAENYSGSSGIWIRMAKKGTGIASIDYRQALRVALCYGWIDGQSKSEGETTFLQKFTPRGRRSIWSKRNREHVANLIEAGRMQPPGMAEVERAKADGRWEAAYDSPATAEVPRDLEEALSANEGARVTFLALDKGSRFGMIFRLQTAKRPETRQRRIEGFVEKLEQGVNPITGTPAKKEKSEENSPRP